jgi:hypothetical protein
MADNNPPRSEEKGDGGDQPAAKESDVVTAINTFEAKYESTQQHKSEHERKVFLWTRRAAIGVFFYTALTVVIAGASVWQGWIARHAERITSRAYVTSIAFQLIHYGEKTPSGHIQWELSPIIENSGNTSTRFLKLKAGIGPGPGPA